MKKRILALILCLASLLWLPPAAINAEEEYLPSVYIADTVWYKDKSMPLITHGNNYYLPIEAYGALPSVSVTVDEITDAAILRSEKNSFSVDTGNGVIISTDGDQSIKTVKENGTVYLDMFETCSLLGLSFEIHAYANGSLAVRINDGSGVLNVSSLIRMFAANEGTLNRMTGEVSNTVYMTPYIVAKPEALVAAIEKYTSTGIGFVIALDANLVLRSSSDKEFKKTMTELYHLDLPITLYAYEENADIMTHYIREANQRLIETFHKGTNLCTTTRVLTMQERAMIESFGFVLTYYEIKEAK